MASAKDIAWSYLKHYTAKVHEIAINETELWVELPPRIEHGAGASGARIRLYGADNAAADSQGGPSLVKTGLGEDLRENSAERAEKAEPARSVFRLS